MTIITPAICTTIGELRQLCQQALVQFGDDNSTRVNIVIDERGNASVSAPFSPNQWTGNIQNEGDPHNPNEPGKD